MSSFTLPGLGESLGLGAWEIVSAYGGGGKTSFLLRLAGELSRAGQKVILTTTTKMLSTRGFPVVIASSYEKAAAELKRLLRQHNVVTLGAALLPGDKLEGIDASWPGRFFAGGMAPYILVEADGAARRPMKGYAPHEPVIPPSSTLIVPLLGADALGLPLSGEYIHRPELLAGQIGAAEGDPITIDHFIRTLLFMLDRGRRQAPDSRAVPIINKMDLPGMDLPGDNSPVRAVAGALFAYPGVSRLLCTALAKEFPVHFIWGAPLWQPFVSCAILAAGFSRRMGEDKLSLRLGEKTVLEHAVESALQSGADEVFVVARPGRKWDGTSLSGDKVRIVENPHAGQGMSSSLKAAVCAANPLAQGIIFALGDQPFVDPEVYRTLIRSYRRDLKLVTYPLFRGRRGNPQLFDRRTWPLLLQLQGDQGGKGVLHLLPEQEMQGIETPFAGITEDIDTPEEYRRYLQQHSSGGRKKG